MLTASQTILEDRAVCKVCAFNLSPLDTYEYPSEVEWQIDQDNKSEYIHFARKVNHDGLIAGIILQHEYGIYGGHLGENILAFVKNCEKPIIVTLHTVIPTPTPKMKEITGKIIAKASGIIVLTHDSKRILEEVYPESLGKVSVIPHGIHETSFANSDRYKKKLKLNRNFVLSTFGLLSRGKGIEYVIKALPKIIKKHPNVRYLVLGETHPVIQREEGEKYRIELIKLVQKLKLKKYVKFYDQYFSLPKLLFFLKATDIYISTSINPNQAVSGTLSYALGTGRAVVSTSFPQARETITDSTGKIVNIKNSKEYAEAVLSLMRNKKQLKIMNKEAYDQTRYMLWKNVSKDYMQLLSIFSPLIRTIEPVLPPLKLNHLRRMTDHFGLFQFAHYQEPNKEFGYTADDNARALIICSKLSSLGYKKRVSNLLKIYLDFLKYCQKKDGTFVNYINQHRKITKQNEKEDLEDANARIILSLSEVIANEDLDKETRNLACDLISLSIAHTKNYTHQRARAYVIKALVNARPHLDNKKSVDSILKKHANALCDAFKSKSEGVWKWFDNYLSYNNAILPESLLIAGNSLKNEKYSLIAKESLQFLIDETFRDDFYFPIGHSDWYKKGETRSEFDQQPEDPASMILSLVTAYKLSGNEEYQHLAHKCFSWFLGSNILGKSLYNYKSGGCFDGLHPDRVNQNQGAESLVSYLLARIAMLELA